MRPSAGTPYFARVPETPVSPRAPQDRDQATGIASPLRTPEPKADAINHATHQHLQRSDRHRVRRLSGSSACRKRHRTTLGGTERRAGIAAARPGGAAPAPAQIHTLTSGMPGCGAPSSRPEPALLAAAAAVLPDPARAADGPSSKPNPGHGGHSRDQRCHRPEKQPQKEATHT